MAINFTSRVTSRAYSPSGANDSFTYDNGSRLLSANRNGWLDTFAYDGADRVTNTVQNGRVLTYSYNLPGRVITNTQPSGRTLEYTYDGRSRLVTLQDGMPTPIATYFYDGADRVIRRSYRNGTAATYSYNANSWITSLDHSNSVPSLIAGFNYLYDNEGNKLYEAKVHQPTNSESYAYDALNRLTNYNVGTLSGLTIPSPTTAKGWNLDPVGNWSTVISNTMTETRTHGPANELLMDNSANYLYDADGNLMQDSTYRYTYDEENRLTRVQRLSDSAMVGQYFYDALSRRVEAIADPAGAPSTNLYFYDQARLVEEQTPLGSTLATYTYGNYVDEVLTMDRSGQTYYYHQNALWSAQALSDGGGNVAERYAYDAYGHVTVLDPSFNPVALNPWGTPHSAVANRFLFTGRELDEETGMYYYRARGYGAEMGRWLQRDPLDYLDSMNLYEYVRSQPTHFTDPSGRAILCEGVSGFAAYAIAISGSVYICTDNCNPRRTAIVVCAGGGGGAGASIGVGPTIGTGCLSPGWSGQLTVQGVVGVAGISGSAGLTDPEGVPVSGGGSVGPGAGFAATIEGCRTWILSTGGTTPPRRPAPPDPPRPAPVPCCQCYNYGVRTRCTTGRCGLFSNFGCQCGHGVNYNETGPCRGGVDCRR